MMEQNPAVVDQLLNPGHFDIVSESTLLQEEGMCTGCSYECRDDELTGPQMEWREERVKDMEENDVDRILARPPTIRRKLLLEEAPEFVQRLGAYKEIKEGETLSFSGTYRAFPLPTIKWYKDEEELQDSERISFETSSDQVGSVTLTIHSVEAKDEGVYKCKVENQEGVASTTGYLCVIAGASPVKNKRNSRGTLPTKRGVESVSPSRNLRPIVEQSSMEAQEEEVCRSLGPSPLSDFIDVVGRRKRFSRQAPGPIVFHPYQQIKDGMDADFDNVFDCDSDSPSSPSEQLTPRLIALPSLALSSFSVTSQSMAPPIADNFRNNISNDDSDYDSDTTPRAMIVEPSNLISMSLDSEATLWEDFLAGGTGLQKHLSRSLDEVKTRHGDCEDYVKNSPANINNPILQLSNPRQFKPLAVELTPITVAVVPKVMKDIWKVKEEIQQPYNETKVESEEFDTVSCSPLLTTEDCGISRELAVSKIGFSNQINSLIIEFPANESESTASDISLLTQDPTVSININHSDANEDNFKINQLVATDPIVVLSESSSVSHTNENLLPSSTNSDNTSFLHEAESPIELGIDLDNESDVAHSSCSLEEIVYLLEVHVNPPVARISNPEGISACAYMDETFVPPGTDISSPILTPHAEDLSSMETSQRAFNNQTLFRAVSQNIIEQSGSDMKIRFANESDLTKKNNILNLQENEHFTDMKPVKLNKDRSQQMDQAIKYMQNEKIAETVQNVLYSKNALTERNEDIPASGNTTLIEETLIVTKLKTGTSMAIFEKINSVNTDAQVTNINILNEKEEQESDERPSCNLTADNIVSSCEVLLDQQIVPVLPVRVELFRPNFCKKNAKIICLDDDNMMGMLLDYLDVASLQFYLLFVTISMAIAATSDVPYPAYLVATTALIVLLVESCKTIVTN